MMIKPTAIERFKSFIRINDKGCWIWIGGYLGPYGCFSIYGKSELAHRVSMHLFKGFDLKSKNQINHINDCLTKACVNYDHLKEGDAGSNADDHVKSGKYRNSNTEKTHCPQGHEYNEENTYYASSKGRRSRFCRICNRKSERKKLKIKREVLIIPPVITEVTMEVEDLQ